MRDFELILALDELTAEQEDAIYDNSDALIAGHTGSTRLTATAHGADVIDAAKRLLALLASLGVTVRRFCEDFVTRGDIAQRADVSRQAVGLWVRGERLQDHPFPEVYSTAGGGIWIWGEVDRWLRDNVKGYTGDDIELPTRGDYLALNQMLVPSPS